MAYTVLKKEGQKGNIVHFLADTTADYAFIVDECDPGSTIMVLDEPEAKGPDTYMKAPSGKWIHIDGQGDKGLPVNNAVVKIPAADVMRGGLKVGDMQSNVQVYESGLVTGTVHAVTGNTLYKGTPNGHFLNLDIPTPEGTDVKLTIKTNGTSDTEKKDQTPDGSLSIRLENLDEKKADTVTIEFKDSETSVGSYTFNLSQIKRD